jgi:hypothetical protein
LSLMGGMGMFGAWAYQTFFLGPKLDSVNRAQVVAAGNPEAGNLNAAQFQDFFKNLPADVKSKIELMGGHEVLNNINLMPIALIVLFAGLYFYMKKR